MRNTAGISAGHHTEGSKKKKRIFSFVPIIPTSYGFLYLLVLFGALIWSSNYNNNTGFALTFLMGSITLVSIFHTFRNLRNIEILRTCVVPVFEGEKAVFEVTLRARRNSGYAIEPHFKNSERTGIYLEKEKNTIIRISLTAFRRGTFSPGPLILSSAYPFGFCRAHLKIQTGAECLVYPKPLKGPIPCNYDHTGQGEGVNPCEGIDDFRELRAYRPGDPLQRIAWKASSRGHGLLSKQFQAYLGPSKIFSFESIGQGTTEEKLSWLCREIVVAENQNRSYGLRLPEITIPTGNGESHYHHCLRALALFGIPLEQLK